MQYLFSIVAALLAIISPSVLFWRDEKVLLLFWNDLDDVHMGI